MNEKELEKKIIDLLKSCYDPEIPVDIYELGLIYEIRIKPFQPSPGEEELKPVSAFIIGKDSSQVQNGNSADGKALPGGKDSGWDVEIIMTLTSPNCPVAESLPLEVENRIRGAEGVNSVKVTITFDPPWEKSMMSEAAQLDLGFM